jgi:galactokinase
MSIADQCFEAYASHFQAKPAAAAYAPGRVEIIGNHTDYNGGFVMSAALDKGTVVAGAALDDEIILYAPNIGRTARFSASSLEKNPDESWANYVLGVVDQLRIAGVAVGGFQAAIYSDVPKGAGLSSSAALEVATALFLKQLYPYEMDKMAVAQLCQRAENQFVGVNCGILDQFSSMFGHDGSLLFLDCLSLMHSTVRMSWSDVAVVICDSVMAHSLTGGDYNTRHAECMAAAAHFGKKLLRDVSWEEFTARESELPDNQRKRARHVLAENRRVLAMREAVQGGDAGVVRRLLAEGHASCRDLFENTTVEIDFLVEAANAIDGCIGARLTGGGWGGCTLNLVRAAAVPAFSEEITRRYQERFGLEAKVYACAVGAGAHFVEL